MGFTAASMATAITHFHYFQTNRNCWRRIKERQREIKGKGGFGATALDNVIRLFRKDEKKIFLFAFIGI